MTVKMDPLSLRGSRISVDGLTGSTAPGLRRPEAGRRRGGLNLKFRQTFFLFVVY